MLMKSEEITVLMFRFNEVNMHLFPLSKLLQKFEFSGQLVDFLGNQILKKGKTKYTSTARYLRDTIGKKCSGKAQ